MTKRAILDAIQRRLSGSANRIAWTANDVARIAERFGVRDLGNVSLAARAPSVQEPAAVVRDAGSGGDEFVFTISTPSVDRMGDTIAIGGWKLAAYRKNPVVLWAHDGSLLPVGRATAVWVDGNRLRAKAQLAPASVSSYAVRVGKMLKDGFLNATSVGFAPLKYAFTTDPARQFGIDFQEQELLEFSIVPVPANADCLLDPPSATGRSSPLGIKDPAKRRRAFELELIRLRGY